ncbi:hypothetical protein D187_003727 [Cystobacter fuscus DSM 2262]|uniref:Uncharacterized protein n=1 Tax=Cystobacter fuscus (strain ATCC 25194 / DSM 2262 / NBRC 100088 / M29) TaxID=1242864 RepID=S9P6G5_CYSF2|nr:hypothetical protein [Cystobacter fuscus]EPX58766.1 hypothetical protein D187_003727 [Cystobacter fuscus DSM 2262]
MVWLVFSEYENPVRRHGTACQNHLPTTPSWSSSDSASPVACLKAYLEYGINLREGCF